MTDEQEGADVTAVFLGPLLPEFFPGQPDEVVVLGLAVFVDGEIELLVIASPVSFDDTDARCSEALCFRCEVGLSFRVGLWQLQKQRVKLFAGVYWCRSRLIGRHADDHCEGETPGRKLGDARSLWLELPAATWAGGGLVAYLVAAFFA